MLDEFLSHIFNLALSPFTSNSLLVWIPAGFAFCYGCVCLTFRLIRRA